MGAFLWTLIARAFWESLHLVGGTPGAIALWLLTGAITALLALLFRGRDAFVEHLKANIAIVIAGACLAWGVVFVWRLAWLPHDIRQEAERIPPPRLVNQPNPPPPSWAIPTPFTHSERQMLAELEQIKRSQRQSSPKERKPFIVTAGPALVGQQKGSIGFVAIPNGPNPVPVPINIAVLVGLINRDHAEMIEDINAEALVGNRWVRLQRVDTIGRELFEVFGTPKLPAISIDSSRFIDRQLNQRILAPNDAVMGWAFYKYPRGFNDGGPGILRITVSDSEGNQVTSGIHGGSMQGGSFVVGTHKIDLTPYMPGLQQSQ